MGRIKTYLTNKGWSYDRIECLRIIKNRFFKINWFKTIFYNLYILPINQAIKIPIIIGYNVKIRKMGKIILDKQSYPGMISIGAIKIDLWESNSDKIIFSNYGEIFIGGRMRIHPGAKLVVYKKAKLNIGNRVVLGCMTKLICCKHIEIGSDVRISWNSQIFDTDFHFLSNKITGKIYKRTKPVTIASNTWIGNSVTIGKGTQLPKGTLVSCCSKVSGDFSQGGEGQLLMGNPAHCVGNGFEMTNSWFPEKEVELSKKIEEE